MIGNEGNGLSDEIADMADTYYPHPLMEAELWSRLMPAISAHFCSCMSATVREDFWENNMRYLVIRFILTRIMMRDITIENDSDDTRTHKIFKSLVDACLSI